MEQWIAVDEGRPSSSATTVVLVVVAAVAVLATFLRPVGVPAWRTIWAEDGTVFAACAWDRSPLLCLTEPYAGYHHAVARLGAFVVPIGDPADLSLRLTLVTAAVTAIAAVLVGRAVLDLARSSTAALCAAAALVLVEPAGREVLGNLTNLHWVLLVAAVVITLATWTGRAPRRADLVLVGLAGLSSAFAPLLAVLGAVGVLLHAPGARRLTVVTVVAAAVQVVALASGTRPPAPLDPDQAGMAALGMISVVALGSAIAIVVALLAVRVRGADGGLTPGVASVGSSAGLLLVGGFIFSASSLVNAGFADRYSYAPLALGVIAAMLLMAWMARAQPTWGPRLLRGVALVLAVLFLLTFRLESLSSPGPDAVAEIEANMPLCEDGVERITVPISPIVAEPPGWVMAVPCAGLVD